MKSFIGRIGRINYLLHVVGAIFIVMVLRSCGLEYSIINFIGLFYILYVGIKRVHDFNKSSKYILVPYGGFIIFIILLVTFKGTGQETMSSFFNMFYIFMFCHIILILIPGTKGHNKYGDLKIKVSDLDSIQSEKQKDID